MDNNLIKQFTSNYKQILVDEIALEGLEGIGLDYLWRRVAKRLSADLTEKMKARYWQYIVNNNKLSFYEIPEPYPYLEILDRFTIVDETSGHLKEPEDYLDGPYEYHHIENEHGSSKYYYTRKSLNNLNELSYDDIVSSYGDKLVIVADIELRWHALAPHMPMSYITQMMPVNYCLLELIGRSRENGQMSVGKSNLHKISKDSKTLFYNRKHLQELDLINLQNLTQIINGRGIKCILIRLKRFHTPSVLSMPKVGTLRNVIDYLLKAPDYCERSELLVKKGVLSQKQNKRLQKTVNIFSFQDKILHLEDTKGKKIKHTQKRKYICLSSLSDESSQSEDESNEVPLACQYKVGVSLMRQAYELFLDAGLQGLTQMQLSHLLGIEFYTSRAICRIFRLRNIVREYLEDKGKQRTARFIAVVATEKMDKKYEEQKLQFLEYLEECKNEEASEHGAAGSDLSRPKESQRSSNSDDEVPQKKIKLEKDLENSKCKEENEEDIVMELTGNEITELKVLDGFENSKSLGSFKKNPTLRQLKFANGILKVLKEKHCISGYMTLSNLASKEVNEPPMDPKALKSFIQKLVNDGHIKMYKLKWPGLQKYSVLVCAHHIKISDPIVTAKYKEVCMRALANKKTNAKKEIENNPAPAKVKRTYPRYLKIQKLHEFIMNFAYFDPVKPESHSLRQGFICVVDLFPEATIGFLINNLCTSAAITMYQLVTDSQLNLKLKDAPPNIYNALMKSKVVQNSIRINLKALAMLGLIQLVSHPSTVASYAAISNYSSFLFYVNRRAKIIDTSGTWPRNRQEAQDISFYFETPEDVTKYWSEVYTISTNTEILLPERGRKQLVSPLHNACDVEIYDIGTRHGDGLGPCGFDSCFYMEIPRLWQTFHMRPNVKTAPVKKPPPKTPKFEVIKTNPKPKAKPRVNVNGKRAEKRVVVAKPPPTLPLKRKRPDMSVKWSKHEDLLLTICKAAITIMSPSSQPGSLIIRNTVAKDLLSINDPRKTKGLCHSRAAAIDTNISLIHEKQCILNEMRRRRNLIQKYEGLLKKLRLKFSTNMSKYINKARLPMMELIWTMLQVMRSKSYTEKMPCVAVSLEDFHAHFTITASTANKICNMYKIPDYAHLKEAIMVTIMQTLDGEMEPNVAKKLYTTFSHYPESELRVAVEQLRRCTAIAAKEKVFYNQFRKLELEDIVQSSYKISVFYCRKWQCRFNLEFSDKLANVLKKIKTENDIRGSAEVNCASCELEACNVLEIVSTTVPAITDAKGNSIGPGDVSAVIIDSKYNLKTGSMRWKKKNNVDISELYQKTDFNAFVQKILRHAIINVDDFQNQILDMNDQLISHLKNKGQKGATFTELQDFLGYDDKTLVEKLLKLQSENVIRRVGFYENVIILAQYFKDWSTKFVDKYIISTPWLKLMSGLKVDIFFKWAGLIMNTIFEKPGCSIAFIADKCECITYRATQDICMFLEENNCIVFKTVKLPEADLFSDVDVEPIICDYNPFYAPENILAYPTKNCATKYSFVRKWILKEYADQNWVINMDKVK